MNDSILVFLFNVALNTAALWIFGVDNHVGLCTVYVTSVYIGMSQLICFSKSQMIMTSGLNKNLRTFNQKQIYSRRLHMTIMPFNPAHPNTKDHSSENVLYKVERTATICWQSRQNSISITYLKWKLLLLLFKL